MRTRQTSYNDYGLSTDSVKRLMKQAQSGKFNVELMKTCTKVYSELSVFLFMSLVLNLSYDRIELLLGENIPIDKGNFYGYRRLALSEFAKLFN